MDSIEVLKNLPIHSGVYLMFDRNYHIIYVGKAKNIKKRVSSYFQKEHIDEKTRTLVSKIEYVRWIMTKNEVEAFILENNLIKLHRPKYNILLKDEKGYPYVGITKERFPKIVLLRKISQINPKRYRVYGPFLGQISFLLEELINGYQIRNCSLNMEKIHNRPCIRFQLNKCLAPCVYKEVQEGYSKNIGEVEEILKGKKKRELEQNIEEKMALASFHHLFEKAIVYRNQLALIKKISQSQEIESLRHTESEDAWAFKQEDGVIYFCVLEMRNGKVLHKYFDFHTIQIEEDEAVEIGWISLVFYYYQWKIPPKRLLFNGNLEAFSPQIEAYFDKVNSPVSVIVPKIESHGKQLVERAQSNLNMEFLAYSSRVKNQKSKLEFLQQRLGLKRVPNVIECFDISNIQGKDAVGSMSSARSGETSPEHYRKYKIKTLDTPDDFGMLREVIYRRYSKLEMLPDLIVVDGGKGQLSSVALILRELALLDKLDLISLAKREEEVFVLGESESILLSKDSDGLKLLQKLRDEAHRFGITYHRVVRERRILSSELDDIPQIGPQTKRKLLEKFLTVEAIRDASEIELCKVVPLRVAKNILNYFKENKGRKI